MDTDGPTLTVAFAVLALVILALTYFVGRGWIRFVVRSYDSKSEPSKRLLVINIVLTVLLLAAISFAGFAA